MSRLILAATDITQRGTGLVRGPNRPILRQKYATLKRLVITGSTSTIIVKELFILGKDIAVSKVKKNAYP